MLSEKMEQALNEQVNAEIYSGYLYLSMSAYLEEADWPGFAKWMRIQAEKEWEHGRKIYDYIIRKGARVTLKGIESPQTEWDGVEAIFEHVLEHEQFVTSLINNLVDLAIEEKDHATNLFLQWYVEEQVEEEENAMDNLARIQKGKDSIDALFMLDKDFGARQAE